MDPTKRPVKDQAEQALIITRTFDAPRDLVWKAWTQREHFTQWWGPNGFTTPSCKMDVRVGGVFHYCMRSPEGKDVWCKGVYREIKEPERLAFTDSFADEAGNTVEPTRYGMSPSWPKETPVVVTFAEQDGKTKLTLKHDAPKSPERDMAESGWNESLDRLAAYLKSI